jgi:hypothetical protein
MGIKPKAHVLIEEGVGKEIDRLVGKKKRSHFVSEATKKELKRLNQLALIHKLKGAWRDEDHPELAGRAGTYRWVRALRAKDEKALRRKLA